VTLSSEHDESKWVPVSTLVEGPYPEWLRRAAMVIQGPAAV
jgi:hypothetical protein